jgi:LysM repeat protein
MKHRYLITSLVILFNISVLVSQEKSFTKHSVSKGETISQIATRYNVTPYDIYKLNPDAQSGIQENDLILIPTSIVTKVDPVKDLEKPKTLQNKIHITKPKETLYSIARDYNINVSELKILNTEAVEKGLKIGQTIKIPVIQANVVPTNAAAIIDIKTSSSIEKVAENKPGSNEKNTKDIFHIVEPKETKFGIAKKYGITVQELEQRNPKTVSNLPVGTKLIISGAGTPSNSSKAFSNKATVEKPKPVVTEIVQDEIIETKTTTTLTKSGYANYEVKQGETIYSLTQYFNVSEDELLKLNPTFQPGAQL